MRARIEVVGKCQAVSLQGWSGGNGGPVAAQACVRFASDAPLGDAILGMTDSVFQGGFSVVRFGTEEGSGVIGSEAIVIADSNTFINDADGGALCFARIAPMIFRNNIGVWPDIPAGAGAPVAMSGFTTTGQGTMSADDRNQPIRIFSNTFYDHRGRSIALFAGEQSASFTNVQTPNNITFGADTSAGPLNETAIYDSSTLGVRLPDGNYVAGTATPADAVGTFAPLTTSGAIGAATTGIVSYRDRNANNRADIATAQGRSPSDGAVEPDLAS